MINRIAIRALYVSSADNQMIRARLGPLTSSSFCATTALAAEVAQLLRFWTVTWASRV